LGIVLLYYIVYPVIACYAGVGLMLNGRCDSWIVGCALVYITNSRAPAGV
jgi:hypothetical protein